MSIFDKMKKIVQKIYSEVSKRKQEHFGRGVDAAAQYLVDRIREELDVPAESVDYISIPGLPPRKRTGELQKSITYEKIDNLSFVILIPVQTAKGFFYGRYHNEPIPGMPMSGRFPFVEPTYKKHEKVITKILKRGKK